MKKIIAPVIITAIILFYLGMFVIACMLDFQMPIAFKIFGSIIPIALAGVSIYVLVERIMEIRSGEEDDLSKY